MSGNEESVNLVLDSLGNGVYWQPNTDDENEGNFINDPDVPNDREGTVLDWKNDFAYVVILGF